MTTTFPGPAMGAFPVLQEGAEVDGGIVYVPADPGRVLWGRLPHRSEAPVARIGAGDHVVVDTISHEGILEDQGSDPVGYFGRHGVSPDQVLADAIEVTARRRRDPRIDGPHIVTGPIAVDGARPGDLLAVCVDDLRMRAPYGVVSTRHGRGVLTGHPKLDDGYSAFCSVREFDGAWFGTMPLRADGEEVARFPLAPFLGIIGVATDTETRAHSVPPGLHGGNIDIRLLTPGATLFLPVQVPDALLYVGDPHYAQGNGEVALTALEAPLRASLTVDLIPAAQVRHKLGGVEGPFAAGHGLIVPTGMDEDLGRALRMCVGNAVELVTALFDMDPQQAYLYLSAATDFDVSQAVDLVTGVHGSIRVADFPPGSGSGLARRILDRAR
jgi:acetamidase/formamidase